ESILVGRKLKDIALREHYGVNVALIERGTRTIVTPGQNEKLYPGDNIAIIGTDEQLTRLKPLLEQTSAATDQNGQVDITLTNVTIGNHSRVCGRTIGGTGIRERAQAIIVGVERNGERILNPDSAFRFNAGDIVWIVGNKEKIRAFLNPG